MSWYRVPRALRILILAAAWFSYGALLLNLNSLDDGGRTAEIIWGACAVGLAVTALIDTMRSAWRLRLWRSRLGIMLTPAFAFPYLIFGVLTADASRSSYRVLLIWMFLLCGVGILVTVCKRITHIKQRESAVRHRHETTTPMAKPPQRVENRWRVNAESPMAERFITTAIGTSVLAFVPLLLADLDSIVYGDNAGAHLARAALVAAATAVVVTGVVFWDPRLRATTTTIESILQYDRAFRTCELPEHFDVDQWRSWMKSHHRSDAVTLIWACFFFIVGCWAMLSNPSGYHWVLAILLAALAAWFVRRWQYLCRLMIRLEKQVERHSIRQLFG